MNVDVKPAPTRLPRALRCAVLLMAASLFIFAVLAGWRMVQLQRDNDASHHERDAVIAALRAEQQQGAEDRATASQDRATASRNQQALLDYTKSLADRQRALLAWLHAHGVSVPPRFLTVVKPPRIITITSSPHHHAASGTRHHAGNITRTPKPSTAPAGPGKSGSAPGHRKHHHPKRH